MIDIISLLQTVGGIVGGLGLGMFTKSGRLKAQAESHKMMAEAYEYRIAALHESINKANETENAHLIRIAEQNRAIDDKTEQIRNLTQKLWDAEQETNRVNNNLVKAQEEICRLNLKVEHYREWRCYRYDCQDIRGRKPKQEHEHFEDGKEIE